MLLAKMQKTLLRLIYIIVDIHCLNNVQSIDCNILYIVHIMKTIKKFIDKYLLH